MTEADRIARALVTFPGRVVQSRPKIDARVDGLQQEFRNSTRSIIGTIVGVSGVAVALASWLVG